MKGIRMVLSAIFLMLCSMYFIFLNGPGISVVLAIAAVAVFISSAFADERPKVVSADEPDPGYEGMPDPDLPHCPHCNKQHGPQLEVCPYCGTKLKE